MLALLETIALGFMVGLSGVTFPGPVLVYIVQQSVANGWKSGFLAILAHALVGVGMLVLIITTGITTLFGSPAFMVYIGLVGGVSLIVLGVVMSRNSLHYDQPELSGDRPLHDRHPFLGGIVVSVSNPQFFLWWAVIGLPSVMVAIDLSGTPGLYGWTMGILASIFIWYGGLSFLASHGKKHFPPRLVCIVSFVSGCFLIISGIYLFANYFLKPG
jgi:threonine/homoserine/homoserine lactone efflux protein